MVVTLFDPAKEELERQRKQREAEQARNPFAAPTAPTFNIAKGFWPDTGGAAAAAIAKAAGRTPAEQVAAQEEMGNLAKSVVQQNPVAAALAAPTAPAPAVGAAIASNPYDPNSATRKAAATSFEAALQPQIRKATDTVTSSVNPFMTGNVGASLMRDVQSPMLAALSQFETGQNEKAQGWEADQQDVARTQQQQNVENLRIAQQQKIENLRALATSENATQTDINAYRAALGLSISTTSTPTSAPTSTLTAKEKSDTKDQISLLQGLEQTPEVVAQINALYTKLGIVGTAIGGSEASKNAAAATKMKPQIDVAVRGYKNVSKDVPDWVANGRDSKYPVMAAWDEYENLGTKIEDVQTGVSSEALTQEELARFNKLSQAFNWYLTNGGTESEARERKMLTQWAMAKVMFGV